MESSLLEKTFHSYRKIQLNRSEGGGDPVRDFSIYLKIEEYNRY